MRAARTMLGQIGDLIRYGKQNGGMPALYNSVETLPKMIDSLPPMEVAPATTEIAITEAISAYSIAVTARRS